MNIGPNIISGGPKHFADDAHVWPSPLFYIGTNITSGGLFHFGNGVYLTNQLFPTVGTPMLCLSAHLNAHIHINDVAREDPLLDSEDSTKRSRSCILKPLANLPML